MVPAGRVIEASCFGNELGWMAAPVQGHVQQALAGSYPVLSAWVTQLRNSEFYECGDPLLTDINITVSTF